MLLLNFMRTGYYDAAGPTDQGGILNRHQYGFWWSGTSGSATRGRYLNTYPSSVRPQVNSSRGDGYAIRCTIRVE